MSSPQSVAPISSSVRWLWRGLGLLALSAAGWLGLCIHPDPLFAHELRRGNLVLHARTPLPPETAALLDEVALRLQRSPLYEPSRVEHAYLCNSNALFSALSLGGRGGGLTSPWRNVFIRSADVATGRVFDRDGAFKGPERTLTYYLAHEFTHALTFARYGFWHMRGLSAFQREGYSDYVGFARPLDLPRLSQDLRDGAPEMDTQRSALYLRYELLVAHLLETRQFSVDQLFEHALVQADVESELLARLPAD